MEHQDSVTRPFFGIVGAYVAFFIGYSIYSHTLLVLLWGFGFLLGAAMLWAFAALLNIAIFALVFHLLAKLTSAKPNLRK